MELNESNSRLYELSAPGAPAMLYRVRHDTTFAPMNLGTATVLYAVDNKVRADAVVARRVYS